jgi:hypothetical protein
MSVMPRMLMKALNITLHRDSFKWVDKFMALRFAATGAPRAAGCMQVLLVFMKCRAVNVSSVLKKFPVQAISNLNSPFVTCNKLHHNRLQRVIFASVNSIFIIKHTFSHDHHNHHHQLQYES